MSMNDSLRRSDRASRPLSLAILLAIVSCGGGGSGAGAPSVSMSFAGSGGVAAEGGAPLSVRVVLHTTLATLASPASIVVADAGTGTATGGADYAAFASQTLSFPAGSLDGDVQSVDVGALTDQLVEGANETIQLQLEQPSGGAIGTPSSFTVTINDSDLATIEFAASASSTSDESSGASNIAIRLDLPAGTSLGVPVSVRVSDAGGGSATAGSDYAAFSPQTISFPIGSQDGALQLFALQVIDDNLVEVDETVRLSLSQPSAGGAIGATSVHQLTIQDDDATGSSAFVASEGPTGVENPLTYDELVGLGSQTVGAGPNAGTRVRISNAGGSPMALAAPRLTGANPNDFDVEVELAPEPPPPGSPEFVPAPDAPTPLVAMSADRGPGLPLSIDFSRVRELVARSRATLRDFPVPGRGALTLDLHRLPLPFSADAVLAVDGVPVAGGPRVVLGDLSLWSGSALEVPDSRVFVAFSSQGSRGFLELPDTEQHIVHFSTDPPASGASPAGGRVVLDADIPFGTGEMPADFCSQILAPGVAMPSIGPQTEPPPSSLNASDCRLAIETDYQLYQRFGSTGALTTYVTQLISAVSQRYFTDVQTTLSIAYLGVHSSAADPWTSQDSGGNATNLLNEFVGAWGNNWPVQADLAHFISGANLGGGVAYVNVLCNQGFGFGVSGNISGTIDWGGWTGQPASFTWDFVVVAHEMGHNFGSQHTHSYCPPLDHCYANCDGTTTCSQGTIMSYCHVCGGMDNIDLLFHPVCANIMRGAVNASCLGLSALAGGGQSQRMSAAAMSC
jgi:hypothetical protein